MSAVAQAGSGTEMPLLGELGCWRRLPTGRILVAHLRVPPQEGKTEFSLWRCFGEWEWDYNIRFVCKFRIMHLGCPLIGFMQEVLASGYTLSSVTPQSPVYLPSWADQPPLCNPNSTTESWRDTVCKWKRHVVWYLAFISSQMCIL